MRAAVPDCAIGRRFAPTRCSIRTTGNVIADWPNLSSIGTGPSTRLEIRRITRVSRDILIVIVVPSVRYLLALRFILIIDN